MLIFCKRFVFPTLAFLFEVLFFILYICLVRFSPLISTDGWRNLTINVSNITGTDIPVNFTDGIIELLILVFVGLALFLSSIKCLSYSAIGFTLFLGCVALQWGGLVISWLFNSQLNITKPGKIDFTPQELKEALYGVLAMIVAFGALIGRASTVQLLLTVINGVVIYGVNRMLLVFELGVHDFGGSMSVFSFGAFYGVFSALAMFVGRSFCRPKCSESESGKYIPNIFGLIGSTFMFIFFPIYNAALYDKLTPLYARAVFNTIFALTSSVVITFIFSSVMKCPWKLKVDYVKQAIFSGGVAISSVAALEIQPWGAILIGVAAAFFTVLAYRSFKLIRCGCENVDICVMSTFGVPGFIGGTASAICAAISLNTYDYWPAELLFLYPAMVQPGSFPNAIRSASTQGGYQFAALILSIGMGLVGGLVNGILLRWVLPLNSEEEEQCRDEAAWFVVCNSDSCCVEATEHCSVVAAPKPAETSFSTQRASRMGIPIITV